ncbi:MAG: alanine racemase [Phycisphaeraceae bacterium]
MKNADRHTILNDGPTASRLEVNLIAISQNLRTFRHLVGHQSKICAVVKKNAYGLGVHHIAPHLKQQGVDRLGVYSQAEAEELLALNLSLPVITLGPIDRLPPDSALLEAARQGLLEPTLHTLDQLHALNQAASQASLRLPLHLYIDTGMSRSGFAPEELPNLLHALDKAPNLHILGVHTHLATADTDPNFAQTQLNRYLACLETNRPALSNNIIRHAANSYATLRHKAFHLDMIRPGLGLYGCGFDDLTDEPRLLNKDPFQPVVRWLTTINHIAHYPANTPVGYGSTWTTPRDVTLAVVPIGYGDGYPVALSNKATMRVLLHGGGHLDAPVRGRVNMDQVVLDLTDAGLPVEGFKGAIVEVISADPDAPNTVPRLARLASTHSYEILCRLSPRISRKHLN